jgi:hypothetical protein
MHKNDKSRLFDSDNYELLGDILAMTTDPVQPVEHSSEQNYAVVGKQMSTNDRLNSSKAEVQSNCNG